MYRIRTTKPRRRDSYDGDGNSFDVYGLAQYFFVVGEAAPPSPIAQDRNGRMGRFVSWCERAASNRLDSEAGEEVAAHHSTEYFLRRVPDPHGYFVKRQWGKANNVLEDLLSLAHRFKHRHGHGHVAVARLGSAERLVFQVKINELLWIRNRESP